MHSDDDRRAPVDRIRILDGDRLREVLRAIEDHCGGSRKAAKKLGMVHSTFNRLLTGVTKTSMKRDTYTRIREFLKTAGITESDGTVKFYLPSFFEASLEDGRFGFYGHRYQEWLDEELKRLQEVGRRVVLELWELPACREIFERHLRKEIRTDELPQPHQKRQWLALYRAVEPLTKVAATWGVERSWQELQDQELQDTDQLQAYLSHALAAERIILDREGDLERMSLRPPPNEFWAEFHGVDEGYEPTERDEELRQEMIEMIEAERRREDDPTED